MAAEPAVIDLRSTAQVDGESILLGQVAEIVSDNSDQADVLRNVELGRAPLPGQSLLIHRSQIEMRLKHNGVDPQQYRIADQGPIKVLRNQEIISAEQIRAAVEAFIKAHAPWSADQMTIRPIHYAQDHGLPCGRLSIQITAPKHTDWLGAVPFKVIMRVDGREVKRTSVPAYIEVWQEVILAGKPLGRNQPITAGDIRAERMNLARVPANAVVRKDQVLGRRANRSIAVNSVLRLDQVDSPPVVRKGDVVQVLAESNLLRITTQGVAQGDAGIGERIRVLNMASKKKIHARVVDAQMVQVDY